MGDPRRFDLFSSLIRERFQNNLKVADVAGGKGYLQLSLREKGFNDVVTFDQRNVRVSGIDYRYQLFNSKIKDVYDILVGMHTDEASDWIIVEACRRRIPFVICPCCIKPSAVAFWNKHTYKNWSDHLCKLAESHNFGVTRSILRMNGRNEVLLGLPI